MKAQPEKLYLDLMKKTLSFTLWPEPPIPIELFASLRSPIKQLLVVGISELLKSRKLKLVKENIISTDQRLEGRTWPICADTMIGLKRLDNLQYCIETVINEKVDGDLIETGVWRGGACIFMRAVLAAYGVENRKIFVADSFKGLPEPDIQQHIADKGDTLYKNKYLAVSRTQVENNFAKYGLLDDQVFFLEGWFKNTLPTAPIEKLSILRLDGDMYGSTIEALNSLYPKLSPGGFCIIDDHAFDGCAKAVADYREKHGINTEIKTVDWTCVYWRKM